MAINNILTHEEINFIVKKVQAHGGLISYKTASDGNEIPYELNITWFSALNYTDNDEEDLAFQVKRFVASRSIALVLQGVPGIYFHSLIGTPNDIAAVLSNHSNRDINRTVLDAEAIVKELEDPLSKISRISRELGRLIIIRTRKRIFHPNSDQKILELSRNVFAVLRKSSDDEILLALTNITDRACHLEIPVSVTGTADTRWFDIVSKTEFDTDDGIIFITMQPYDVIWLEPFHEKSADRVKKG
jgi:sucrose phosphorylase